ncbi:MAG: amino acid adenylation domain-containing protein, partial [Nitrospiraceae bacterium]|nr:amino acid adenylation domain-containing protein [Nitrospiraceae bacterium]
ELHEMLDVAAFQRAWRCIVARHPVLRTKLRWENISEPRQEMHAQVELPWEEHDWRGIAGTERDKRIAEFLIADRRRGFELTRAPLFRLILLCYGEAEFHLIWTFHHTVLEARSFALALRELFAFYEAFRQGKEISLPLPRPYRDYIDWLQQQDFSKDEAFWRETLKGFTTPTPLIVDHVPDTHQDSRAGSKTQEILLSTQTTSALRTLAQDNQLTLNTIVQGAWALLLSRYSGEEDIVFGVIRANRRSTIEGAEAMIGLFLNTLPLRVRVKPEAALIPWLREIRLRWMAMRGHEQTPLANVQTWSEVPAGSPLFQSTMMFENYDLNTELRKQRGAWSNRRFRVFSQTNYPIDLAAFDGTELRLTIDFDRGRIDDTAAERMIGHVRTLLEAMAVNPYQTLGELPLLTSAERQQLVVEWNQTAAEYPGNSCIHELFETQMERTPETIAVTFEGQHLSYRELNRRSNQLAHHLRELGVRPDVLVGIYAERSFEMVIGLLGILKAGGAYVPIDPTYPAERVVFMLNDASAPVMLAQANLIQTLPALKATKVVSLDGPDWTTSAGTTDNLPHIATGANLAYVIYTSGSTGRPKGAMIPHRAIVNHMRWMQSRFPMNERDCVLQKTQFSFDVSVWEFFAPLIVGARLVVARSGGHQDPAYLVGAIIQHQVTILQLVPSLLRMLLETSEFKNCRSLRHIFCGGEAMTEDIPRRVFTTVDAELHNMYGPTEVAIDSIYYSVPRNHSSNIVPIGRPVANTQAYVLDRYRQPVPIGVPGELYLGGVQVGRGYHNQPELTAASFIPDIFSNAHGARLYKTGDKVRFLADGNIEFMERIDHQVKIRGFRIELGEIEWALQKHPAVRESVVVVPGDAPGDKRLVAYVISAGSSPALVGELRSFLTQQLPAYMVPAAFVLVDAFPLTPNGKLDRKALPPPEETPPNSDEAYVAPRTPTEEALAASWRKIFQLQRVGVHDDFFELGGHSLMLVQLISEINSIHKGGLSILELIRNPTVEQLARLIDSQQPQGKQLSKVVPLQKGRAELPVYFIHARTIEFRIAQHMGESHAVFGIEVQWPLAWRSALANNRKSDYPSLEQVVAPYVAALSAHTRSSLCVLAGYSFAGLMAFEAAHQFEKQGGKVDLVILIDTPAQPPNPFRVAWHTWRQDWKQPRKGLSTDGPSLSIGSRPRSSWIATRWLLKKGMTRVWSFFNRPVLDPNDLTGVFDEQNMSIPAGLLERLYEKVDDSYRPRFLDSRGILFRADPTDGVRTHDDNLGWNGLFTRGLEIIPIVGDHFSIFREHIPTVGREINEALKRHWPDQDNKVSIDDHQP